MASELIWQSCLCWGAGSAEKNSFCWDVPEHSAKTNPTSCRLTRAAPSLLYVEGCRHTHGSFCQETKEGMGWWFVGIQLPAESAGVGERLQRNQEEEMEKLKWSTKLFLSCG